MQQRLCCAGTLPDSWSGLAALQILDMSYNQIKGLVPQAAG